MNRNRQQQRQQTHEPANFSDSIRDMEREVLQLSTERNDLSEQAITIKTDAMLEVKAEWTAFQAKALSNQTKRNVAADGRMASNEEYQILVNDIRAIDQVIKGLVINISFERRQFARETNHIEDIDSIRKALCMIAEDIHGVATALEQT